MWGTKYQLRAIVFRKIRLFLQQSGIFFSKKFVAQRQKISGELLCNDIHCTKLLLQTLLVRVCKKCHTYGGCQEKISDQMSLSFFICKNVIFMFSVLLVLSSIWPFIKTALLLGVPDIDSSFCRIHGEKNYPL